jgi:hypothetical protein
MLYFIAGVVIGAIFNAYVLPYINKVIAYFKAPPTPPAA